MTEGRVLWRVAAGPRIGFGHLVRTTSLAHALGVSPIVSLRSGAAAREIAGRLGVRLAGASLGPAIARLAPRLVIVDDPSRRAARRALAIARRAGTPVASIHDLGLAWIASDLLVDGSIVQHRRPAVRQRALLGPTFAVLNVGASRPLSVARSSTIRPPTNGGIHRSATVLIALGGGPHVWLARAIARHLVAMDPTVRVRIAGGVSGSDPISVSATLGGRRSTKKAKLSLSPETRIAWIGRQQTLGGEFDRCTVAIVGGGVSAYEACARGTAAIGVAVVPAQRVTVAGLAAAGAMLDGGLITTKTSSARARRVAARAIALARNDAARRRLAARAWTIVDGRGAARVARAVRELMREPAV